MLQVVYSFDHIVTADIPALPKVIGVGSLNTISANGGRDNSGGLVCNDTFTGMLVAVDPPFHNVYFGAWMTFQTGAGGAGLLVEFDNPAATSTNNPNIHVCLVLKSDGSLAIHKSHPFAPQTIQLAISPPGVVTFGNNASFYVEANIVIGASGSAIVRVNEAVVLNAPNINTQNGPDGRITFLNVMAPQGAVVRYDDMYVVTADTNGDGWNGFAGILKIKGLLANGNGDVTQWTPSVPTGINYQNVDEPTPNPSDHNDAVTAGLIDVYQIEDIGFDPVAVQTDLYCRKLDAGPASIGHVVRLAGTNYVSTDPQTLSAQYRYYRKVYTSIPSDNSAWSQAIFNAIQAGPHKAV